jgi:hypothetical protein
MLTRIKLHRQLQLYPLLQIGVSGLLYRLFERLSDVHVLVYISQVTLYVCLFAVIYENQEAVFLLLFSLLNTLTINIVNFNEDLISEAF